MNLEALLSSLFQPGAAGATVSGHSAGPGTSEPFEFPAFLQAAAAEADADAAIGTDGPGGRAAAGSILEGPDPDGSQGPAGALESLLALVAEIRQAAGSINASADGPPAAFSEPAAANPPPGEPATAGAPSTGTGPAGLSSGSPGTAGTPASFDGTLPAPEAARPSAAALNASATGAPGFDGGARAGAARRPTGSGITEAFPTQSSPGGNAAGRLSADQAGDGEAPGPALDRKTADFRQPALDAGRPGGGEYRAEGADRPAALRVSGFAASEAGTTGSGLNVPGDSKAGGMPGDDGQGGRHSDREHRSPAAMEALRSAAPPSGENGAADPSRFLPFEDGVEADMEGELKPGEAGSPTDRNAGRIESGGASTDPATRTGRNFQHAPLSQLLDKAVFRLKNGQSEAHIRLKPETLGQVRLQIATENQQVTLKILTEIPAVKEMIENNIGQLRADLQAHGLEIDKLEVSVAGDSRNSERHAREGRHRRGERQPAGMEATGDGESAAAPAGPDPVSGTSAVIDYFA